MSCLRAQQKQAESLLKNVDRTNVGQETRTKAKDKIIGLIQPKKSNVVSASAEGQTMVVRPSGDLFKRHQ
jgi:hypothetical protein